LKNLIHILTILLSCGSVFSQNDTTNRIDNNGMKQGYWIYYGKDRPQKGYPDTCKIEEGRYVNDRKEGLWRRYNMDGSIRIEAVYHNNRPHSPHSPQYGTRHPTTTRCHNAEFDSIIVHLNHTNSYGPTTDTTATFYPGTDEITLYVDSLSRMDLIDQSPDDGYCSHAINIIIDRYINGTYCRVVFNTCRLNDGPGLTARECAKKVFGFN